MVPNEYQAYGSDPLPSFSNSQSGYPGRYHTAFASEQPFDTERYSNDATIGRPSHSVDGHGDTLVLEDISGHDTGYDGDVEVIAPYEYEEAESMPPTPRQAKNPARSNVEMDDLVKAGLIDAMRELDCDSDETDYEYHRLCVRRQKRKGKYLSSGQSTTDCSSDAESLETIDLERYGKVFTPGKPRKRRRRRRRRRRAFTGDTSDSQNAEITSMEHASHEINTSQPAFPAQGERMDIG
ncbi:hypothetical protein I7I51_04215 [Histoplasma capsulatum]|uniref:Uncharacterized protein n=1 Tax=Ajellomyces capsulatus TaxID=5037 RepID=A0A8A1M6C0_AJECA|nr:hypothetical protein I7I51_04215 [Histoplasma capsulatum]